MHPFVNTASKAAFEAEKIIMKGLDHLDQLAVTEKSKNNYVTEVDIASEQSILYTLQTAYPTHGFLAEESGETQGSDPIYQWIIDPLDGTNNFIHGYPHFAISIALKVKDRVEHALVYDPVRRNLFTASRGQGAYLNNRRIRVSKQPHLSKALTCSCLPAKVTNLRDTYMKLSQSIAENCLSTRIAGAAALDMAYVAAGFTDGFWAMRLKTWDVAAGALLIKEAGGVVSDFDGTQNFMDNGDIISGNMKVYKELVQLIKGT